MEFWEDKGRSATLPERLLSLMRELGELKRVGSSGRAGSIAQRSFVDGWAWLVSGSSVEDAMRASVGAALTKARLGDVDARVLHDLGVGDDAIGEVLRRAFDTVAAVIDPSLAARLVVDWPPPSIGAPDFVERLAAQPRAGATCPGRPRMMFQPAENHAEHCAAVATYAVLLSPLFDAEPATVWLASMAHHLHNAYLPDAGFTGETLLGSWLGPLMERATSRSLSQLPVGLAASVAEAMRILPDAGSAEGRAFHAADTLDRVWQAEQHLRPGRIGLDDLLGDMALVHDGPVKPFQDYVLRAAGLSR